MQNPVEIIVMDDASTAIAITEKNIALLKQYNIPFYQQRTNQGRNKIRKLLAGKASYEHLLFLDNDVLPPGKQFLQHYLNVLHTSGIYCGGCIYQKLPPPKKFMLHWKYGQLRETKKQHSPIQNNARMGDGVQLVSCSMLQDNEALVTANLLITKTVILGLPDIDFPAGYGHEDTWLTIFLKSQKKALYVIDNPVFHLGLKSADQFIADQGKAVLNLLFLYHTTAYRHEVLEISALARYYDFLKRSKLDLLLRHLYYPLTYVLKKGLHSSKPPIKWLDLYKLLYAVKFAQ